MPRTPEPPPAPSATARELERAAASAPLPPPASPLLSGEVVAMLARRGFAPRPSPLDVPFPGDLDEARAERLTGWLDHYAFRLFLRGAILGGGALHPREASRYVPEARAETYAAALEELGLAAREADGRVRLLHPALSFGGTLEWYVARQLRARFGFEVAAGLKFHAPGEGGDLDVVAAAEGKLLAVELKSSPPKHVKPVDVEAFLRRMRRLRPHVALFVVDTSLRLSDKVLPLFRDALGPATPEPRRVLREVWAVTPHLYVLNAQQDLVRNLGAALAEGLAALAPPMP
jgi:hypothetical protein